jgi:aquaporin Z
MKKYVSEFIGTTNLILLGCGSILFNNGWSSPSQAIAVAMAFGLTTTAMMYTFGNISGCHINPAITLGMFLSGRIKGKEAVKYTLSQILGALLGTFILFVISCNSHFSGTIANTLQSGVHISAGIIAEIIFTCVFVLTYLGATDEKKGAGGLSGFAIGLALTVICLVCLPLTGASLNPARSISTALFEGGKALTQLWIFILAPLTGGALAATIWQLLGASKR